MTSQKTQPGQTIPKLGRELMRRWSYILGGVAVVSIISALIVSISDLLLPENATPENNVIAYLNDIGFQAFYFFGFLTSTYRKLPCMMFSKL